MRLLATYSGIAAVLLTTGCLLFISAEPTDDSLLDCNMTVRNPNVTAEQEGVVEEDLFSRASPFLPQDGVPFRDYTLVGSGLGCVGAFLSTEAAAQDWRIYVRQRIGELAEEGDPETVFGMFADEVDGWCAVASTVSCTDNGQNLDFCGEPLPPLTGTQAIPDCPPPSVEPCRKVECADGTDCEQLIDFGEVAVGETGTEAVTISNCADVGGPVVEVGVDLIDPVGERGDFTIVDLPSDDPGANTCHPLFGDGQFVSLDPGASCGFTVAFTPQDPGSHTAEIRGLETDLVGSALGGSLTFEDVTEALALECRPPEETAEQICIDDPADPCTGERIVRVTNTGPGEARISSVRIVSMNPTGFQVEPSVGPANPIVIAADDFQDLDVRWCDAADLQPVARLVLDWNAPAANTCESFRLILRRNCPQP